jgi:hypothetical protein
MLLLFGLSYEHAAIDSKGMEVSISAQSGR